MELVKDKKTRSINRTTKKYFLDFCKKNVIGDTYTRDWLIMKNLLLDKKMIQGILYNTDKVVIKLCKKEEIDKEYNLNIPKDQKYLVRLRSRIRYS